MELAQTYGEPLPLSQRKLSQPQDSAGNVDFVVVVVVAVGAAVVVIVVVVVVGASVLVREQESAQQRATAVSSVSTAQLIP